MFFFPLGKHIVDIKQKNELENQIKNQYNPYIHHSQQYLSIRDCYILYFSDATVKTLNRTRRSVIKIMDSMIEWSKQPAIMFEITIKLIDLNSIF